MQRLGWVGKLKADCADKYLALHANPWPAVLARNADCNLRNYSIFYQQLPSGEHLLFSYAEYVGDDFQADMRRMAADAEVQRWWSECKPCFQQIDGLAPGEVWLPAAQVFYQQ